MNKQTFRRYTKRLRHYTEWIAVLHNQIYDASTKELKYLLKYKDELSQTNCGWSLYQGLPIIEPMILEELERRKSLNK